MVCVVDDDDDAGGAWLAECRMGVGAGGVHDGPLPPATAWKECFAVEPYIKTKFTMSRVPPDLLAVRSLLHERVDFD